MENAQKSQHISNTGDRAAFSLSETQNVLKGVNAAPKACCLCMIPTEGEPDVPIFFQNSEPLWSELWTVDAVKRDFSKLNCKSGSGCKHEITPLIL